MRHGGMHSAAQTLLCGQGYGLHICFTDKEYNQIISGILFKPISIN